MQIITGEIGWIVDDVTIPPPKHEFFIGYCKAQGGLRRFCITSELEKALSLN
jgi:hypothetical protein